MGYDRRLVSEQPSEDALRLLELLRRHRGNRRRIWLAVAIMAVCTVALVLQAVLWPTPASWRSVLPVAVLSLVGIASMWLVRQLLRENDRIEHVAAELARKLEP